MKKWNIYFILVILIVFLFCIINKSSLLLSISSITGVIYSLLIAKNNKLGIIFGLVNVSTYGIICLYESLYGALIYNLGYSVPMLIFGLVNWFRLEKTDNSGIKSYNKKQRIVMAIMSVICMVLYGSLLYLFNSENIILDSFTSVLGYLAIYLLINKYYEQWFVFNIVNLANFILWILLVFENVANLPMMIMWLIYLINSLYGTIHWNSKYIKKVL